MISRVAEWLVVQAQRRKIRRQFREKNGYNGNFENPRTYSEKVQFRKLYGNHDFYSMVADKYRVRPYVESKVGAKYLIPLLGAYDQLEPSVFDTLPDSFIIKANHGCKWHQIVEDKRTLDIPATIERFNGFVRQQYGSGLAERHYQMIKPKIVIEQLLQGNGGGLPWDYNFFCYHGPAGFDYCFSIASPGGGVAAAFTRDWEMMDSTVPEAELEPHLKPGNFDEMVRVARDLSADFDFVRIDLYTVGRQVYFGEITCTPSAGYGEIQNEKRREMRTRMWHLDARNPLLYRAPATYR